MQKQWLAPFVASFTLAAVVGCSDNSSSSSSTTATVTVQTNQNDIAYGFIRSQGIGESGLPSTDFEQQPIVTTAVADSNGSVDISIPADEVHQFQLVGRIADSSRDIDATTRKCQWSEGCGSQISFGTAYPQSTGLGWRVVAYDLSQDEVVRITPLTDLAAELGRHRVYIETYNTPDGTQSGVWDTTGFYSPQSVVQSVSQLNKLFGVEDIQACQPMDLTRLDQNLSVAGCNAQQSIRYGAILAAWQKAEFDYQASNPNGGTLSQQVAGELVANNGQLMQAGTTQTINLAGILTDARQNLVNLEDSLANATVKANVAAVIVALQADIDVFAANIDTLSTVIPDNVTTLLGDNAADIELGVKRTKAFIAGLRGGAEYFFEDGYWQRLQTYRDQLRAIGDTHQDSFNAIVDAFVQTKDLYLNCLQQNAACSADQAEWLESVAFSNKVMTLNSGAITVSQAVADTNTTDNIDDPTESQAIDLLIKGRYQINGLAFVIDHTYTDEDEKDEILSPAGIRIYYPEVVSEASTTLEEIGYEIRWADFNFYADDGTETEFEVEGAFSQFYIGVKNPDNDNGERRFNIESVALNGRVSDVIEGDDDDDKEVTNIIVSARSNNADEFYPEKKFASFNGFLNERENPAHPDGEVVTGLAQFEFGSAVVSGNATEHFDFNVPLGDSYRYRFYPNRTIEDDNDLDGDGETDDNVVVHDFERCDLNYESGSATVKSCDPKQRLLGERDVQDALNDLWEVGVFARVHIKNRGTYFIDWDATADNNQCLKLDALAASGSKDGTLYAPEVLGLNSMRFYTQISLNDETSSTEDPDTLLDAVLTLTSVDNYQLTAALSHDYTSTSVSTVTLGGGSSLDRILLSYSTQGDVAQAGSIGIFKDGVALGVENDDETVDSEITAFVQQNSSSDPLPYKFITNEEGRYERCVLVNQAEYEDNSTIEDATITLNFRDVVYGRIRQENGVWVVRYVNGDFETLL